MSAIDAIEVAIQPFHRMVVADTGMQYVDGGAVVNRVLICECGWAISLLPKAEDRIMAESHTRGEAARICGFTGIRP